jgi:hypothetical protein
MRCLIYLIIIYLGACHAERLRACPDDTSDYSDADLLAYTYDYPEQPPYLDIEVVEPEPEAKEESEATYSLSPELEEVLDHWNKLR